MPQRPSLLLFLACLSFLDACKQGPVVTVYLSDPARAGMESYNSLTNVPGFSLYKDTDKFVCFNPTDAETLFNYCSVNKR